MVWAFINNKFLPVNHFNATAYSLTIMKFIFQAKSQINEEGLVPVTFAQSQKGDDVKAEPK